MGNTDLVNIEGNLKQSILKQFKNTYAKYISFFFKLDIVCNGFADCPDGSDESYIVCGIKNNINNNNKNNNNNNNRNNGNNNNKLNNNIDDKVTVFDVCRNRLM